VIEPHPGQQPYLLEIIETTHIEAKPKQRIINMVGVVLDPDQVFARGATVNGWSYWPWRPEPTRGHFRLTQRAPREEPGGAWCIEIEGDAHHDGHVDHVPMVGMVRLRPCPLQAIIEEVERIERTTTPPNLEKWRRQGKGSYPLQ